MYSILLLLYICICRWVEVVEKAAQMVVCEVPVNQDNRMSVSYGSRNRVRSKSLQDIVDSDELVPAPLTPPCTRVNKTLS